MTAIPSPGTELCHLDDLADPGGRGFDFGDGIDAFRLVVVRRGGAVHAYVNSCPHMGISLDWTPDQFLSHDDTHILCATHGALFEIDTGLCIAGPCYGESLIPFPVRLDGARVVVDELP